MRLGKQQPLRSAQTPAAVSSAGLAWLARHWPLLGVLLAGLGLRLLLWGNLPRTGWISDEGEYFSAATWLAEGRGFAWYREYLWTRAPLYPLFVAAHLWLFGGQLAPVYATQTLLSLVNIALVYVLARRLTPASRLVPALATLLMAVYLPFAIYPQVLLSETLFLTLLLAGFLALTTDNGRRTMDNGRWTIEDNASRTTFHIPTALSNSQSAIYNLQSAISSPPHLLVSLSGLLFGLATLTRSLTLFFMPVVALWLLFKAEGRRQKEKGAAAFILPGVFLLAATLVIVPWTLYNSRFYGGPVIIDTSGAFNLLLGARTAHDGQRRDAQVRDFVLGLFPDGAPATAPAESACAPYPGPLPSQAARQSAMTREGLCLIADAPLAFAQKSLAEFVDLFQINYGGAERFTDGFGVGRLPRWYALATFLLDDLLFVLTLPLAVVGWALAKGNRKQEAGSRDVGGRPDTSFDNHLVTLSSRHLVALSGLWWAYNLAVAPLLFAINRFRLPLLPFAFIFAAYAVAVLAQRGWRLLLAPGVRAWSALAAVLLLLAATPYAYLEPRAPGQDSRLASLLGPHPSSLADTWAALTRRAGYEREQRIAQALGSGDAAMARALLADADVSDRTRQLAEPLLARLDGRLDDGLALLPSLDALARAQDVERAVVRGDLLRAQGDLDAARATFALRAVRVANPLEWAWDWLRPMPTRRIDLGDGLDLGYLRGCYPAEPDGTRWCTDGAQLRFPAAGTGAPQSLVLRVDGRGWPDDRPLAPVQIAANGTPVGSFTPARDVRTFTLPLPAQPIGADLVVTLHMSTFVPPATRYLSQQGAQAGQVHQLGLRLDWAELQP